MKLTIERAALLKALGHVQSAVERRGTIPILANVLIDVSEGALTLTATDMDLTIVEAIPVDMVEAGSDTAPARTLHDIVRKLPEGPVTIATGGDGSHITVKAGRSRFKLATLPKEDFPNFGRADTPHTFEMQPADLRNLIDLTSFAMATNDQRYYLDGIYLQVADDVLRGEATDGHRLARFDLPVPEGAGNMLGVIIPSKTIVELRKLLDETVEPVVVSLSENKIHFAFDSTVLSSKLVDGNFPDCQRVIPVGNDKIVTVNCRDFAAAVDRVSTIASEKNHAVKLVIEGDTITIFSHTDIGDEADDQVEISYGGAKLEIGFNFKYVLDVLQNIAGDTVEFGFADENGPALIKDPSNPGLLYLIMPTRY